MPKFNIHSLLVVVILASGCTEPVSKQSVVQTVDNNSAVPDVPVADAADEKPKPASKDPDLIPLDELPKSEAAWQKRLSDEEFYVTREKGTEPRGTNKYNKHYKDGIYRCVCCGEKLFDSATKYDSGSGWPAFWKPYNDEVIQEENDDTLFTRRIEVLCKRCGAHLGHVFEDGPADKTGLRYCINSVALKFQARADIPVVLPPDLKTKSKTDSGKTGN